MHQHINTTTLHSYDITQGNLLYIYYNALHLHTTKVCWLHECSMPDSITHSVMSIFSSASVASTPLSPEGSPGRLAITCRSCWHEVSTRGEATRGLGQRAVVVAGSLAQLSLAGPHEIARMPRSSHGHRHAVREYWKCGYRRCCRPCQALRAEAAARHPSDCLASRGHDIVPIIDTC